jgi:hypothetical protein
MTLKNKQKMIQYVIYKPTTKDHPGKWVVRRWYIFPGVPKPTAEVECDLVDTLEEAREKIPFGTVKIDRYPEDDPVIQEIWM